ncbi:MAG: hypothetical protein NC081_01420 [Roseburia sp.]|nr:hypothetical protein [Roseburia sp.]
MSDWTFSSYMMILLQLVSAGTAGLLFFRMFADKYITYFGVLLYLTCPYRLFVCFRQGSLSGAAVWALLPLYTLAVWELYKKRRSLISLLAAASVLTAIGFLDILSFLILSGLSLLIALCCRRIQGLLPPIAAALCCLKPLLTLVRYLLSPMAAETRQLHSIMGAGYMPGEFFNVYACADGHPGLGIGLFIGLGILLWLTLAEGNLQLPGSCRIALGLALFLSILSLRIFPWDIAQRLGLWALRLVSLLETPGIFFGLASFCLCLPSGFAMGSLCRPKEKAAAK